MAATTISDLVRPSLAKGVRLQSDSTTGKNVLLYPEGIVELNETAHEILSRCDGRTLGEIICELAEEYEADSARLLQMYVTRSGGFATTQIDRIQMIATAVRGSFRCATRPASLSRNRRVMPKRCEDASHSKALREDDQWITDPLMNFPSIRAARGDHLPMSAALPVLLKSCTVRAAVPSATPGPLRRGRRRRRQIMASSRRKNGSGSFVKPPRLAFCKSVFPEANHLPGAISPN